MINLRPDIKPDRAAQAMKHLPKLQDKMKELRTRLKGTQYETAMEHLLAQIEEQAASLPQLVSQSSSSDH